ESGILEKKTNTGNYFIISAVIVGNPNELSRIIKNARQKARGKFKMHSIFKASKENRGFVKIVLEEIAKTNSGIIAGIWDKKKDNFKEGKNKLYARLIAETAENALDIYPRLDLVIHKRYTSPHIREFISKEMSQVVGSGNFLSVSHRSEIECRQLELADAVAWAIFQKYNNKDDSFYRIIKKLIQKENKLSA
ncbi:MAG: hypothetical protein CO042_00855, partial [Parcubacteria group bacterium CG_4_9_14_0_2_um_filter_41_8]